MSGHTYFYFSEVKPRLELPKAPSLDDIYQLVVNGTPLGVSDETLGDPALDGEAAADGEAADGAEASGADGEGGNSEVAEAEAAESQDADAEDEDEPPNVK